jgi:hypothetical protein
VRLVDSVFIYRVTYPTLFYIRTAISQREIFFAGPDRSLECSSAM